MHPSNPRSVVVAEGNLRTNGCGSKIDRRGYADFDPCCH